MTTVKELEKKLKQPANLLLAKASSLGFTGSPTDELPQEIAEAIANSGGAKKLNAAPPKEKTEPSGNDNGKTQSGQGLGDIHAAYFASTQNLQDSQFELEKEAAIAMGKMMGHQLYLNMVGAKNQTLRELHERDTHNVVGSYQQAAQNYQQSVEVQRQQALSGWAHSDKTGKTLNQCLAEVRALNASFDI